MNNPMNHGALLGRVTAAAALLVGTAVAAAASAPAPVQGAQALAGCWEPVAPITRAGANTPAPAVTPDSARAHLVCILPVDGTSSMDFVTIADGKASARERVDASGTRQPLTRDECSGWQSAEWSGDGHRLFLRSELTCAGGLKRTSTGVISMPTTNEWVDVQAVTVGAQKSVRTLRYREARSYAGVPAAEAEALGARPFSVSVNSARLAAATPVSAQELVDASRRLDAPALEAWLAQQHIAFKADAGQLVRLAEAGVPGSVIDMVVALSYPERFTVAAAGPAGSEPLRRPIDRPYGRGVYGGYDPFWDPFYRMDRRYYSPYGYSLYGGYGPYGSGYYDGYYMGTRPVVIVVTPDSARGGGRVVNGRGYTQRSSPSSDPASSSRGRSRPSSASEPSGSGSSGGASTGSSSGSSSSGGSSSGERTAKRRPPPSAS